MKVIKILSLICFLTFGILAQESTYLKGKVADENGLVADATVILVSEKDGKAKKTI